MIIFFFPSLRSQAVVRPAAWSGDFYHCFDYFKIVFTLCQSQADKYCSLVSYATYFSLSKDYVAISCPTGTCFY